MLEQTRIDSIFLDYLLPGADGLAVLRAIRERGLLTPVVMLTVYDDGTIELRDKRGSTSSQAAPSDMQALQKLLTSPEFAALQLPMSPPGADQFVYELTVSGRAQPIVTVDGADNPPVLREVIGVLEQLKTQAKMTR